MTSLVTQKIENAFASLPWLGGRAKKLIPWVPFTVLLLWGWRVWNIFETLPAYGDVLDVLWSVWWVDHTLLGGQGDWLFNPLIFFPEGWYVGTFAQGVGVALLLLPFAKLAGLAFAFNFVSLLSFAVAFSGMRRLSLRFLTPFAATLAALLFTFWGFRWVRINGHLNILLGTTLLPWIVWGVERGLESARHQWRWFAMVGLLWAMAMSFALYFVWLGGLVLGGWVIARWFSRQIGWQQALSAVLLPSLIAVALCTPIIYIFIQAKNASGSSFHTIHHLNVWGANLNSLPIPFVGHPWQPLHDFSGWVYTGSVREDGVANFGLLAFLLAIVGLREALRERAWWPQLFLTTLGIVLALGFTLKWNGDPLQVAALRPLNSVIWQIGHFFKPELFTPAEVPPPFADAVPLPGLFLAMTVPFWEGARVLSRYAFVASIGFFPLVALAVLRLPKGWMQWLIAGLLLIEIAPPPQRSVPFPPETHPATLWLAQQSLGSEGIVDLFSPRPLHLGLAIRGETAWQTMLHEQPTVSGAGSVWPAHIVFLENWLGEYYHPFHHPDLVPILRSYRVRYLFLHVQGQYEQALLEGANLNEALSLVQCFPGVEGAPWFYSICVYEILPSTTPDFNLLFNEGWSGQESWGLWMEGTEARARWVATAAKTSHLSVAAFPHCDPMRTQIITLEVNNKPLATHKWTSCDPWRQELTIPADLVQVGWNELVVRSAYAARPVDLTEGANGDSRMLSIGFTKLEID